MFEILGKDYNLIDFKYTLCLFSKFKYIQYELCINNEYLIFKIIIYKRFQILIVSRFNQQDGEGVVYTKGSK